MTSERAIRNLALFGFMGADKSSVGRLAADILRFTFLDTHRVIEARAGSAISEVLALISACGGASDPPGSTVWVAFTWNSCTTCIETTNGRVAINSSASRFFSGSCRPSEAA
jgi:hypothetical protein